MRNGVKGKNHRGEGYPKNNLDWLDDCNEQSNTEKINLINCPSSSSNGISFDKNSSSLLEKLFTSISSKVEKVIEPPANDLTSFREVPSIDFKKPPPLHEASINNKGFASFSNNSNYTDIFYDDFSNNNNNFDRLIYYTNPQTHTLLSNPKKNHK